MKNTFENETARFNGRQIGLPWLASISKRDSTFACSSHWHSHETLEFICCLKGELVYDFRGGEPATFTANMGILIPAGKIHRLNRAIDTPGERIGINLHASTVNMKKGRPVFSEQHLRQMLQQLESHPTKPFSFSPEMTNNVRRLSAFMQREHTMKDHEWELVRLLCCSILYDCAERLNDPICSNPPQQLIHAAVQYLEANFDKPIHLPDLIRYMGYGRSRFFVLFKEHTGLTPNDYLLRFRIRKAQEMLRQKEQPIRELCKQCGIPDPAYFSNIFKRYTGYTPKQFLRQDPL